MCNNTLHAHEVHVIHSITLNFIIIKIKLNLFKKDIS